MRTVLILVVLVGMLSANAQAADRDPPSEQYLCIAEQATGFAYDKNTKQWKSTPFSAQRKYVISKATRPGILFDDAAFQIAKVRESSPSGECKHGFGDNDSLYCEMIPAGNFKSSKANGRFIRANPFGYVEVGQVILGKTKAKNV